MYRIARIAFTVALLGGSVMVSAASAGDALSGLTPVGSSILGAANPGFSNTIGVNNTATVSGNVISVSKGGQVINGAIGSNSIANNNGVTSVMMNTGNNVNFNNAMIVNVITPQH